MGKTIRDHLEKNGVLFRDSQGTVLFRVVVRRIVEVEFNPEQSVEASQGRWALAAVGSSLVAGRQVSSSLTPTFSRAHLVQEVLTGCFTWSPPGRCV